METKSYKVVLLGITSDNDPQTVKHQLAGIFRVKQEKVEELLSAAPVTVKSRIDHQTALKYLGVIQHAGGVCRMEPVEIESPVLKDGRAHGPTVKTCPNCGYRATTADDPLLTAHDGLGECPACGIIVTKFNRKRDALQISSAPVQEGVREASKGSGGIKSAVTSHPWLSLLMVVAVLIMGKNFFFSRSDPKLFKDETANAVVAHRDNKQAAPKITVAGKTASYKVLPGETRDFVLTTYLDFLHRDTFAPISFTPKNSIDNKWEDRGLRVEIRNATVTPITVSLWEHLRAKDDLWVPAGYRQIGSHGSSNGTIVKGKNLLATPFAASLARMPEETSMKIDPADPHFRKTPYTLYRLEYELSVTVPAGSEFDARELTVVTSDGRTLSRREEQGSVCISTYVEWDLDGNGESLMGPLVASGPWKPTKAAIIRLKKAPIQLTHFNRTDGIFISPLEKNCKFAGYCELKML
ncbi:MAG TPA: hypothetical protein PLI53_00260 [Geobacteraceae bacterium]|nr:hypothetical protein [Geobacteraceae bacterium]